MQRLTKHILLIFLAGLNSALWSGNDDSISSNLSVEAIGFESRGASTVLMVSLKNAMGKSITPTVWAEIYDANDRLVSRFSGGPQSIDSQQTATLEVDLGKLEIGKYKAIVIGKYASKSPHAELARSELFIEYLPAFTIAINRNKEIVVADNGRQEDAAVQPQAALFAARKAAIEASRVKPKQNQNTPVRNTEGAAIPVRQAKKDKPSANESQASTDQSRPDTRPEPLWETLPQEDYVVKKNDWLSKLALRFYGNMMKYDIIYEANRDIISDPDLIYPGQRLKIPTVENSDRSYACQPSSPFKFNEKCEKLGTREGVALSEIASESYTGKQGYFFVDFCLTRTISVPSSWKSNRTSSMREESIKIPRPLSLRRFSGANGSLTFSGLKPPPSSLMLTTSRVS